MLQVRQVSFLARPPRRLGLRVRVGASAHDACHTRAEAVQDRRLVLGAAVLDAVVQKRGAGLVLVATILHHQRRDGKKVRHVGDRRAVADLAGVQERCQLGRGAQVSPGLGRLPPGHGVGAYTAI